MPRMSKVGKTATAIGRDDDGSLTVQYHNTVVVRVDKRGCVTLDHGGWRTYTTKARMNQAARQFDLGYEVYQKDGEWLVLLRRSGKRIAFGESPITFKP